MLFGPASYKHAGALAIPRLETTTQQAQWVKALGIPFGDTAASFCE